MADLIANKSMTYATRRLRAGDGFEVKNGQHARVLVAIGKARLDDGSAPAPDIAALRDEYAALLGKRAYHGWDVDMLVAKINEAKADD